MLKDLADSKRLNASIKALAPEPGAAVRREADLSIHSATIVSALFWPPVAAEQLVLPGKVSQVAMLIRILPARQGRWLQSIWCCLLWWLSWQGPCLAEHGHWLHNAGWRTGWGAAGAACSKRVYSCAAAPKLLQSRCGLQRRAQWLYS